MSPMIQKQLLLNCRRLMRTPEFRDADEVRRHMMARRILSEPGVYRRRYSARALLELANSWDTEVPS